VNNLLLSTKLYRPPLRSGFLRRPRLLARLDEGLASKLTLLSAPAGFGKTMLLADWLHKKAERRGQKEEEDSALILLPSTFGWLSLDEQDNDLTRFLTYLIAAWQRVNEAVGQSAWSRLHSGPIESVEEVLTLLINDLNRLTDQSGLVLDDYHLIRNPAVHMALAFLLDHAPPQLHLIIASRSDPPLALARLRVQGELNEIRAADLRFTAVEIAQFIAQTATQPLPAAATDLLAQRTEGWITGLQLALHSLRDLDVEATIQFIQSFGGTNRHVFAYLMEEVWQRQSDTVRQFLLHTALLDRLTAPLCHAMLHPDSQAASGQAQAVLDYLMVHNLFLIPLDENGHWFRYHALFAEAIRSRLEATNPDLVPELHRRASRWYAAHDHIEQALHHALAIQDDEMVAQLLNTAVSQRWSKGHLVLPLSGLLDPLTARELEILRLVATGASNQAIADQLVISLGTVKGHLNHILSKLEAHNRTEAVARARQLGLLP
jgi:LuxR family transcriptional regulator, maltose regulon positive regulatory protein